MESQQQDIHNTNHRALINWLSKYMPGKWRLYWHILFWMLFVSVPPLLIMAYIGYQSSSKIVVMSTKDFIYSIVRGRGDRLDKWLSSHKIELERLSADIAENNFENPCRFDDRFHFSGFEKITLYDPQWNQICTSSANIQPDTIKLPKKLPILLQDTVNPVFYTPFLDKKGRLFTFAGVSVYYKNTGEKAGYLVTEINLDEIQEDILFEGTQFGKSKKIYLVAEDGTILTPPDEREKAMVGRQIDILNLVLPKQVSKVYNYLDYRGKPVLGAVRLFPEIRSILIAEIDRDEAMERVYTLKNRAIILTVTTIFIVLLISVIRARQLSKPLKVLANTVRHIGKGDLDVRIGKLSTFEAQEVANAFNAMVDELKDSRKRLACSASLRAIGELSSSIVHEIRNPLSSIKINLQALQRKVKDDQAYSELAAIAYDRAVHIEDMLNELLNFGKPLELRYSNVTFDELLNDVLDLVKERLQKKHAAVTRVKPENKEEQIILSVDRRLFSMALANLVANSIDAVEEEGQIQLSVRTVDSSYAIEVCDNGPGFSQNTLERVFTPFFTTKTHGTGLGLANVKKIVEYHGGSITAGNQEKEGAVFTILLPKKHAL